MFVIETQLLPVRETVGALHSTQVLTTVLSHNITLPLYTCRALRSYLFIVSFRIYRDIRYRYVINVGETSVKHTFRETWLIKETETKAFL